MAVLGWELEVWSDLGEVGTVDVPIRPHVGLWLDEYACHITDILSVNIQARTARVMVDW